MAESNVSGPWQVEDDVTVGGSITAGGSVTVGTELGLSSRGIAITASSLGSTELAALTSTSALFGGLTGRNVLVLSSTGKLVVMMPTTSMTYTSTGY